MSNLAEVSQWESGIYQFETSDPVEGGPDGIDNVQGRQLGNRTRYLKDQIEAHAAAANPHPQYATIVQMQAALNALVAAAPGALDTLKELADALGDDPNFATTMTNALALKAAIDSPIFTGTPKVPVAAQFDNTPLAASTSFVQRALGNYSGYAGISASRALSAADIGKALFIAATAITVTVPTPSSLGLPLGAAATFFTSGSTSATFTAGSGAIINAPGANAVSSFVVGYGQCLTLVAVTGTTWQVLNSTAALGQTADFAASLSAAGYQKLPGGLIIQWGTYRCRAVTSGTVTYPIAFPNAMLANWVCDYNDGHAANEMAWILTSSTPKSTLSFGGANMTDSTSVNWMAIGF